MKQQKGLFFFHVVFSIRWALVCGPRTSFLILAVSREHAMTRDLTTTTGAATPVSPSAAKQNKTNYPLAALKRQKEAWAYFCYFRSLLSFFFGILRRRGRVSFVL